MQRACYFSLGCGCRDETSMIRVGCLNASPGVLLRPYLGCKKSGAVVTMMQPCAARAQLIRCSRRSLLLRSSLQQASCHIIRSQPDKTSTRQLSKRAVSPHTSTSPVMLPRAPYKPTGPYAVGARDFAYAQSVNGGLELRPDKHLTGRIFYPTSAPGRRFPPTTWLPHINYGWGYGNSLMTNPQGFKMKAARVALQTVITLLGFSAALPVTYNAPLLPVQQAVHAQGQQHDGQWNEDGNHAHSPDVEGKIAAHPVIIFSHGLTGNRNTYSSLCTEHASRGYVVVCVEHADGTASAARLAGVPSNADKLPGTIGNFRYYPGWGDMQVAYARTRWRVQEVVLAHHILQQLNEGQHVDGLQISGASAGTAAHDFSLTGQLDMNCVTVMGHSWGGATATWAAAEHKQFGAAVALDPWWEALPPEAGPRTGRWDSNAPLLVIGSHSWNTPNAAGRLACGGREQEAVLASAASAADHAPAASQAGPGRVQGRQRGPGALLMAFRDSTHHSFDDSLLFFGGMFAPILKVLKMQAKLDPAKAIRLTVQATSHFLHTHLPPASVRHLEKGKGQQGAAGPKPVHPEDQEAYKAMFGQDLAILRTSCAPAAS